MDPIASCGNFFLNFTALIIQNANMLNEYGWVWEHLNPNLSTLQVKTKTNYNILKLIFS